MKKFVDEYLTIGKNKWHTTVANSFIAGTFLGGVIAAIFTYDLIG